VAATQGLPLITDVPEHARQAPSQASGHGHRHGPGTGNPHVWLDPILAQDICRRIAAAFMQADPVNRAAYESQLQDYLGKLTELDQTIKATTASFQRREYVSFHPSFTYFAKRYQLTEAGIVEVAPGREPTPRALNNIIQAIHRYGITVIFSEPQFSPRMAEVLAKEAGVRVLSLDPIGGRPPYDSDYLKMMQYNLATMAGAMK
jgi:zinc transport system substrate-binding protein